MKKLLIVLGVVLGVFLVTCVGLPTLLVVMRGGASSVPTGPGAAAFDAANDRITRYRAGQPEAHGNSEVARRIAEEYGLAMKMLTGIMFTGGKESKLSFTEGHFLTYCQLNRDSVVLLLHVPQLRQYQGDVRGALAELAWGAAKVSAEKVASPGDTMVVALRGAAIYGPIMVGKVGDENPPPRATGTREILHPYFAAEDQAPVTAEP